MLKETDIKYWQPIQNIIEWLEQQLPIKRRVLEVGPGGNICELADEFVDLGDINVPKHKLHKCDMSTEVLPFEDKSFDLVYCRHVLEDMWNPFLLVKEMSRVGKSGYIENPSPLAEMCRGIDGKSPSYRGYHHHRYFVWDNAGVLSFLSKYPMVEYIVMADENLISAELRRSPLSWNSYFYWRGNIRWWHYDNAITPNLQTGYGKLIEGAIKQSLRSTDRFSQLIGLS